MTALIRCPLPLLTLWALSAGPVAALPVRYINAFLENGGGARSSALGGAMAADPADRAAAFENPAGMLGVEAFSLLFSHASLFGGLSTNDFAAGIYPLKAGQAVGGYLLRSAVDDIQDTRGFEVTSQGFPIYDSKKLRMIDNVDYAAGAAYARAFGPHLRAGAVFNLLRRRLSDRILYGAGVDGGAHYQFDNGMMAGLRIKNLSTTVNRYAGIDYEVARPEIYPGFGILRSFEYVYGSVEALYQFDNLLTTSGVSQAGLFDAGDPAPREGGLFNNPRDFLLHGSMGLEYIFKQRLFLRVGSDALHPFTAGAGFRFHRLRVDFAFRSHAELDNSYRLAAAWDVGGGRGDRLIAPTAPPQTF